MIVNHKCQVTTYFLLPVSKQAVIMYFAIGPEPPGDQSKSEVMISFALRLLILYLNDPNSGNNQL